MTHKKLILMALMGVMLSDAEAKGRVFVKKPIKKKASNAPKIKDIKDKLEDDLFEVDLEKKKLLEEERIRFEEEKRRFEQERMRLAEQENKNQGSAEQTTQGQVVAAEIDLDKKITLDENQKKYLELTEEKTTMEEAITKLFGGDLDSVPNALVADSKAFVTSTKEVKDYMNPLVLHAIAKATKYGSLLTFKGDTKVDITTKEDEIKIDGIVVAKNMGDFRTILEDLGVDKPRYSRFNRLAHLVKLGEAFSNVLEDAKKAVVLVGGQEKTLGELGLTMDADQFTVDAMNKRYLNGTKTYMSERGDLIELIKKGSSDNGGASKEMVKQAVEAPFIDLVAKISETIKDAAGTTKKGIRFPIFLSADGTALKEADINKVNVKSGVQYGDKGNVFLATITKSTGNDAKTSMINVDMHDSRKDSGELDPNAKDNMVNYAKGDKDVDVKLFNTQVKTKKRVEKFDADVSVDSLFNKTVKKLLAEQAPALHTKKTASQKGYKTLDTNMFSLESIGEKHKKAKDEFYKLLGEFNDAKSNEKSKIATALAKSFRDLMDKMTDGEIIKIARNSRMPKKAEAVETEQSGLW